ncbi:dihydroneopterin aldolase [Aureimonas populi]|uniref:(5-formylfuran-3-yl)methyl phosphate synthase n=1 Tax=Aureimonas populi TaxID=1701758 RepID=A0ABW5CM55_9HYPH|nr:dihydroneopterin aldolase [Aureimonas populi]
MTKLLASLAREDEAGAAFAAGAVLVEMPAGAVLDAGGNRVPAAFVEADESEWPAALDAAADRGGNLAILTERGGPFFARHSFAEASRFAALCRARGLPFGFAGALEPADVPRLLPLRPDLLGFGEALRREGAFDAGACRALLALMDPPRVRPVEPGTVPDRVFVRDFVQEMAVGAYGGERGRLQRVRFSLEAQVAPAGGGVAGLGEVYSYDRMMDAVRELAARGHTDLVETLAEELAADLLRDPRLDSVTVKVEKLDLGPLIAGVEIVRRRLPT